MSPAPAGLAARAALERHGDLECPVHGAVTTGSHWRFLRLAGTTVWLDVPEDYIDRAGKILGVLGSIVHG